MAEPLWLQCFKSHAAPSEVAKAWFQELSSEDQCRTDDAMALRSRLRQDIASSTCAEVRQDAANGYLYTAAILRAADGVLGIPPPKAAGKLRGAASGDGAPIGPRCVVEGGAPGTLGLWWSDFQTAARPYELLELGITHRLNMAAEVVQKFPAGDQPPLLHVPMRDAFSNEKEVNEGCVEEWSAQLGEALELLRSLRPAGAKVNVSCQMGKNRSAAAILVWMCSEAGWTLENAVEHLRSITALACGNPYLIDAVARFLQVEVDIPLNDAGEEGHWICISPPGTPRELRADDGDDVGTGAMTLPSLPAVEAESCELTGLLSLYSQLSPLETNVITRNALQAACAAGGAWEVAIALLAEMRQNAEDIDEVTVTSTLVACEMGQWERALELLHQMPRWTLQRDLIAFNAACTATAGARRLEVVQELIEILKDEGLTPDVVTFNALLNACERARPDGSMD
eukprot:s1340_g13.t1